jgi:hypothetical protein
VELLKLVSFQTPAAAAPPAYTVGWRGRKPFSISETTPQGRKAKEEEEKAVLPSNPLKKDNKMYVCKETSDSNEERKVQTKQP